LSALSSRLRSPPSGVRPAEDFVGALTGNKSELGVEIRSVAAWLDERRRSPAQRKNGDRDRARGSTTVLPLSPFVTPADYLVRPYHCKKWYIAGKL